MICEDLQNFERLWFCIYYVLLNCKCYLITFRNPFIIISFFRVCNNRCLTIPIADQRGLQPDPYTVFDLYFSVTGDFNVEPYFKRIDLFIGVGAFQYFPVSI